MTREERTERLNDALAKAYAQLGYCSSDDMMGESVRTLLKNIMDMEWMLTSAQLREETTPPRAGEPEEPEEESPKNLPKVVNTRVGDTMHTEVVQPATEELKKPEPTKPAEDAPQYAMTDVRAALAKARGRGVNVSAVIASFGVENFQQLSKEHYPAVMAKLAEED